MSHSKKLALPCWLFFSCVLVATQVTDAPRVAADNWTQFRGPSANGVVPSQLPATWTATDDAAKNVKWKIALAGEGWSSPIVWEDRLYLTAAVPEETDNADATKPAEYKGGGGTRRDDLTKTVFRYEVMCLDAETGKQIWRQTARKTRPPMPRHSSNTYATETPITDGKHIYAYFGMTGVYCFDLDGTLKWERDLGSFEMRAGWGTSSSPVLFDGKLYLQIDNEEQSFLTALDAQTGKDIWRVDRDEKSQYSSPYVWTNSQRSELIVGGMFYRSYDLATGSLLWQLDMSKGRSSATPVASGDRLYVGTEFRNRGGADDGGGFVFAIKPGGSGDITPPEDASESEFVAWKIDRSGIEMASPTICKGHLYFLERRAGNLHCVDMDTGKTAYRKRISGARAFWASPWTDGENVFCLDTSGTTFVIAGGGDYQLVAENEIDEQSWSTPGFDDRCIYFRTVSHLYCLADADQSN